MWQSSAVSGGLSWAATTCKVPDTHQWNILSKHLTCHPPQWRLHFGLKRLNSKQDICFKGVNSDLHYPILQIEIQLPNIYIIQGASQ